MNIFSRSVGVAALVSATVAVVELPTYLNGHQTVHLAQAGPIGMDVGVKGSPSGGTTIGVDTTTLAISPPPNGGTGMRVGVEGAGPGPSYGLVIGSGPLPPGATVGVRSTGGIVIGGGR